MNMQSRIVAAVWAGDLATVTLLVDEDRKLVHARDPFGRTLMEIAANHVFDLNPAFHEIAALLLAHGCACDIFSAARAGLLDHVRSLIAASPGLINAVDSLGRTAMQRAALINGFSTLCDAVVDELFASGAAIDIFTACVFSWPTVVGGEVAASPTLVDRYRQGGTPLLWAVRSRRNQSAAGTVAATLLNAGASVDVRDTDDDENTPLHHAASWMEQPNLIQILVRAGAYTDSVNGNGKTPLDLAQERGNCANAAVLRSTDARQSAMTVPAATLSA